MATTYVACESTQTDWTSAENPLTTASMSASVLEPVAPVSLTRNEASEGCAMAAMTKSSPDAVAMRSPSVATSAGGKSHASVSSGVAE